MLSAIMICYYFENMWYSDDDAFIAHRSPFMLCVFVDKDKESRALGIQLNGAHRLKRSSINS